MTDSSNDDEATPEEDLIYIIRSIDPEEEKLTKLKLLFERAPKLNINFQDAKKDTSLHIAVRKGLQQVVAFLVKNGAEVNEIKNKSNRSPLDIAKKLTSTNANDIINILEGQQDGSPPQQTTSIEGTSFVYIPKRGSNDQLQPTPTATNRVVLFCEDKQYHEKGWYTGKQIKENPYLLFLFGDNDKAKYRTDNINPGGSGQAQITRPYDRLPENGGINGNAIGITTTFYDGYTPDINEFKHLMDKEFKPIETWVRNGGSIVIPCNSQCHHNLGTGIARLEENIPGASGYIQSKVEELVKLGQKPAGQNQLDLKKLKQDLHTSLLEERKSYQLGGLKSYLSIKQNQLAQNLKRDNEPNEEIIRKRLKTSDSTERGIDTDQPISNRKRTTSLQQNQGDTIAGSKRSVLESSNEYSASGLKNTLHGDIYQLKLLMLFLNRALTQGYSFRLATEMDIAEKFDDLVFQCEQDNISVYRFLQAKHKQDESKKISINDLLTDKDNLFSLQKYFTSYRKVKQNPEFNQDNQQIKDFIICTNIDLHSSLYDSFEKILLPDTILDVGEEIQDDSKKPKRLRFKINSTDECPIKRRLLEVLKNSQDLTKLTRKFADCVLDDETINQDDSKSDQNVSLFKSYQVALVKEIIDSESKLLRDDFCNNNDLSEKAKHFRQAFIEIYNDRRKSFHLEKSPHIEEEHLEEFADEVAAQMLKIKPNTDNLVNIEKRKNIIKNNFNKLSGYVLIRKDNAIQFSSAFLNDINQLPGNLNNFRTKLKEKLSRAKSKIPLSQYQFKVYQGFRTCEEIYVDSQRFWEGIRKKKLKLFDNFGKIDNNLESSFKFAEKIANLIRETTSKCIQIKRNDNIITKNIDKLARHILIANEDKIQFSSDYLNGATLPGNLNTFRSYIKAELNSDLSKLNDYQFQISNFPKTDLPNDSVTNIENDIENFLNQLTFAVNQPNEIQLGEIIKQEIGNEFNLIDSELLLSKFQKDMLDWMKEKKGRFLTNKDGAGFFNEAKQMLSNLALTGLTLEYSANVKEIGITFNIVQLSRIQEFLNSKDKQIFNLISPQNTILGAIKVHQILKNTPGYKKDDSYIFIRLSSLLLIQDRAMEAFKAESSNNLLIIECVSINGDVGRLCDQLFGIIKNNNNKQIILIAADNNYLVKKLQTLFYTIGGSSRYEEIEDSKNSFIDLTYETQSRLLENERVIFQEKEIILGKLIDTESKHLIDAQVLSKLVSSSEKIVIGKAPIDFDKIEDYSIDRTLNRTVSISHRIMEETSQFFITYNSEDVSQLEPNQDIVLIANNELEFENLCNKFKKYNIHWLKEEQNELILHQSHGTLSNLRTFIARRRINTYNLEGILNNPTKELIISSEPGMGKSTVLNKLAEIIKISDPSLWVVRITLNDHTDHLALQEVNFDNNSSKAIEFLLKIIKLKDPLERNLFKFRIRQEGRIALLFDGFDEISPTYKEKVLKLLNVLKDTKVENLWITTRPHMRNDLENSMGVVAYTLRPLSRIEQKCFLMKFWNKSMNNHSSNRQNDRQERYMDKLLDLLPKYNVDLEFSGIPLQLRMLAEAYENDFQEFCSNTELDESTLPKKFNLITLYDRFIDRKLEIYSIEKRKDNLTNASVQRGHRVLKQEFLIDHMLLALNTLFSDANVNELLSEKKRKKLDALKRELTEGEEKTGIVVQNIKDRPRFIHRTFAEYFAARWLVEKYEKVKVREFLLKNLFEEGNQVLRNFFDRTLAAENEYELHSAVLSNDVNRVLELLSDEQIPKNVHDKGGRSALHLAAAYGFTDIVKHLLEYGVEVHTFDRIFNWTPLSYADKGNYWDVAELLLQKGANSDDMIEAIDMISENVLNSNDETLLHIAAKAGYLELVKFLVAKNVDMNAIDRHKKTALHLAAQEGHLNVVKYFVDDKQFDVYVTDKEGKTSLYLATEGGHFNIVEYLIDVKKVSVHTENNHEETYLHCAAEYGHLEIVNYLLDKANELKNTFSEYGATPLHQAAAKGHLNIVKNLLSMGCDFFAADDSTPLHWAASAGKLEVVKYFIDEKNIDYEAPEYDGNTPLHLAAMDGRLEVVEYLVNVKDANLESLDNKGRIPLHSAANFGKIDIVKFLTNKNKNSLKFRDIHGNTPLHLAAAIFGNVLRYFVDELKADFNVKNDDGRTLLHLAAIVDSFDVVQYLLKDKKFDCNTKDKAGLIALELSAQKGEFRTINYLLDFTPDPRAVLFPTEETKITPLLYAILYDNEEAFDCLITRMKEYQEDFNKLFLNPETSVDVVDGDNDTILSLYLEIEVDFFISKQNYSILYESVKSGNEKVLRLILEKIEKHETTVEPIINMPDGEGYTPLMLAAKYNKGTSAEILLEKKANINIKHKDTGFTALHIAASNHNGNITDLFVREDTNLNATDNDERTPHFLAAQERLWDIVEYLIEQGAKVDVIDKNDKSILHQAAEDGNLYMLKFLRKNDANFMLKDNNGNTCLHLAADGGEYDTIKYLIEEIQIDYQLQNKEGRTALHLAAAGGKLRAVNYLLNVIKNDSKVSDELLYDTEKYGMTPLHYAALNGHTKVIDLLLNRMKEDKQLLGRLLNEVNFEDHSAVIKCLLENGAEGFIKNNHYTILHEAVRGNKEYIIKLILNKIQEKYEILDEYINMGDNEGDTPLIWAAKFDKIVALDVLLEYKADVNVANKNGDTALSCAVKANHLRFAGILSNVDGINWRSLNNMQKETLIYYKTEYRGEKNPFENQSVEILIDSA